MKVYEKYSLYGGGLDNHIYYQLFIYQIHGPKDQEAPEEVP